MNGAFLAPSLAVLALLAAALPGRAIAAENFAASIKAGESLQAEKKFDAAVNAFEAAAEQAANDTEYGIAVSKKARVQAYDLGDHASAQKLVDEVLEIQDLHAVAKVMALEVKARCQWKGAGDATAAAKTLDEAAKLEGVDWAMPGVLLSLGDCRRDGGEGAAAITAYEKVLTLPGLSKGLEAVAWLNIGITQQYVVRDKDAAEKAYVAALAANDKLAGEVTKHRKKMAEGG